MPKDRLELAMERIDQQAATIAGLESENARLERRIKELEKIEAAESEALHKMAGECTAAVCNIQRKHLRCAIEHGCPREFAE